MAERYPILGCCQTDSAASEDIAHIRRFTQLLTGSVVVLLTNDAAVNGLAVDTFYFTPFICAKMFPFAAGSQTAVVSMRMDTGDIGMILANLAGDGDDCLADFLGDLGQGLLSIDACFDGSSV